MTAHWSDTSGAWSSGRAGTPASRSRYSRGNGGSFWRAFGQPSDVGLTLGVRRRGRYPYGTERGECHRGVFDQALIAFRHVLWFMRPTMDRHSCAGLRRQPHTRGPAITASSGPTLEKGDMAGLEATAAPARPARWSTRTAGKISGPRTGESGRGARSAAVRRQSVGVGPRRARVGAILGTSAPRPGASSSRRTAAAATPVAETPPDAQPTRKRRAMSAEEKKAVSERMTVYWAVRRKAERRKKAAK